MEIVCYKVLELFFVPHLDITVPDKTLDGDELLFFKREVGFSELLRNRTLPKFSRNFRKSPVSGSSSTYSFMRDPSTQTLV